MRVLAAAGLLVIASACGTVPSAATTPNASSTAPTAVSAQTPLPGPTDPSRPMLPLVRVDFSCRLPIFTNDQNGAGYLFVDFPSGKVTPTQGQGDFNDFYDAVVAKWLTVPRALVSPDGRQYATVEGSGSRTPPPLPIRVDIVDAGTGTKVHVFTMPDTRNYYPFAFTAQGVDMHVTTGPGVWRLDPSTGHVAKVSDTNDPPEAEWIGVVDPRDASPARMGYDNAPFPDRIDHRDATGKVTTWLYLPGQGLTWFPFQEPNKLLLEASRNGNTDIYVLSGPNQLTRVLTIPQGAAGVYAGLEAALPYRVFADAHGIWMGHDSMYLFTSSGVIERVHWQPGWPAGPCV
jgi:hypothetical protein